jgi:hypothetical protein
VLQNNFFLIWFFFKPVGTGCTRMGSSQQFATNDLIHPRILRVRVRRENELLSVQIVWNPEQSEIFGASVLLPACREVTGDDIWYSQHHSRSFMMLLQISPTDRVQAYLQITRHMRTPWATRHGTTPKDSTRQNLAEPIDRYRPYCTRYWSWPWLATSGVCSIRPITAELRRWFRI